MMSKPIDITDEDMMGDEPQTQQEKLIESLDKEAIEKKLTQTEDEALSERLLLEEKFNLIQEKYMHALADLDNLRRQSEKRISDAHKYGVSKILEDLVPVLDSLEQSQTVNESNHEVVKNMRDGMVMTLNILLKVLEKFGVKVINPEINLDLFNPAWHEVMLAQENIDVPPNTILAVLQKGYQLHDRLIRPARVIVAKAAIEK
jgi:molecular chaperone GrpE